MRSRSRRVAPALSKVSSARVLWVQDIWICRSWGPFNRNSLWVLWYGRRVDVRGSQLRCLPEKRKVQPSKGSVSLALVKFIFTAALHEILATPSIQYHIDPNLQEAAKMNSTKRKERPSDNEKGRVAKRTKVCNVIKFPSLLSILGYAAVCWESLKWA